MEKLSKKLLASSCLFCANSSTSVRKFKITEDYGGGNTIRYDLTSFLGHQIEPYLKDDDLLCSNCMNFFENMAYTKRRLIDFLRNRDESEDIKMQGFSDIWKGFKKFAVNLVKFNPNESEENWDSTEVCGRSLTPNPLVHTYSEPYNQAYEKEFSEIERARSKSVVSHWDGRSETDLELKQIFSRRGRRKKRGHNWTRRRGEQKSRALSRTYPAIYDNYERNCYTSMTTISHASSDKSAASGKSTSSRRKRRLVEGKPVRTRSVSRLENYLANVTAEKESNKFYCEEINCSLFFEKLENFVLHKRYDHNIIARFPCQLCRFKGTTRQELEMHHSKLHDKETILCFQCRAEIQGTYNLQEHLKKHQEYSIGCKFCYLSFLSKADLVEHVSKDHQGKRKKVHEKPSFVLQTIVNKEKVLGERFKTNNNNSLRDKHKEFKCIVLNVEKSPSPEPVLRNCRTPVAPFTSTPVANSDKSPFFTVISGGPDVEGTINDISRTEITSGGVTNDGSLEPQNVPL
ncbi:uncharacterized protein LOC123309556 isoform X2 [Coccinella septempunctata]|uniref:uncharacterized protein LOC123309556 isoform X2 n=1 Tax=Coccinella septempunctata TaxID=41139 RepID=UPI001D05C644|nr:uncharacterized protein LOC123309556 isoform X2 [Coccinella septempunctata]